jgi:AhpD family alkylhydroperoxidase
MTSVSAINHELHIPDVLKGFVAAHGQICKSGLDDKLRHLIELRASQLNQCAYCVKMHTEEARRDGESHERIERIMVWRHVDDFTPAERAVLAWTEAVTLLDQATDYEQLRNELREHFDDSQISAITSSVAMINLWNRMQVSNH